MEHTALLREFRILAEFDIQRVGKTQNVALPLILAEVILTNLEPECGKRLLHRHGTSRGRGHVTLGRLIGNRVRTGRGRIEISVVGDDERRIRVVRRNTEQKVDLFTREDFHRRRGDGHFQGAGRVIRGPRGRGRGRGIRVVRRTRIIAARAESQRKYENESQ